VRRATQLATLVSFVMPKYATVEEVTPIESGVRPPLAIDGFAVQLRTDSTF
jgi:hypothetical protein